MSILTGEKVDLSLQQQDRITTASLNELSIYGRTQSLQTDLRVLYPSITGAGTNNVTATEDIVLTSVNWFLFNNVPAGTTINSIFINGVNVFTIGGSSLSGFFDSFPLPNVLIKTGDVVSVTSLDSSGTLQFGARFLGYKT